MVKSQRLVNRPKGPPPIISHTMIAADDVRAWIESGEKLAVMDALITPEIAKVMMEYNVSGETNRRISKSYLGAMSRALMAGTWENTGEALIFSDEKLLNDGQHRLLAIIETGIAATMDLRFGVPRHAFAATNSGHKRQPGEALGLLGISDHANVAAATRLVLAYHEGMPDAYYKVYSNLEIVAAVERWPDIVHAVHLTQSVKSPLRTTSINALSFFALETANETMYKGFFEIVNTGGGRTDNPPHVLREYLMHSRMTHSARDRMQRITEFACCIQAWNAWRGSVKKMSRLSWRSDSNFPTVDGLKLK